MIAPRRCLGTALRAATTALAAWLAVGPLAPCPDVAGGQGGTSATRLAMLADPVRDAQWQLAELAAEDAWRLSTGEGVTVAVIDSGVDGTHPDLVDRVLPGTDLVSDTGDGRHDPVGHGTTVAALIAGRADDGRGVAGLAPDAKILPVRVLDKDNRYDDATVVAKAVHWAVNHGAQVINLSLGGTRYSQELAEAIDYAFAGDVVVVACTGNVNPKSPGGVWYPAREPGVIAVAGLEPGGSLWAGSLTGAKTVLTAPASTLLGARPGGYWEVQGTSFAAPLVAATAALIRSRWPDLPAGEVVNRLIRTARDLGEPGRDDRYGFGQVDPVAALTAQVPPAGGNPLDDDSSPGAGGFGRMRPERTATTPTPEPTRLMSGPPDARPGLAVSPGGGTENRWPRQLVTGVLLVLATGGLILLVGRSVRPFRAAAAARRTASRAERPGDDGPEPQ